MRKLVVLVTALLFIKASSQEHIPISKDEILAKVKDKNAAIRISQQEVLMAKGDFNQANAIILPNIGVSHTGIATTNPLMAFGSKLNQGILVQQDFDPNLLNNPSQIEDYATRIEVQQPLLNFDGIYERKAAKSKWKATEFNSSRTQDYMLLEVDKAYMQLQLAYKTVEVLEKVKTTALENKRIAQNNFEQGYLQKSDILAVEVRVAEINSQLQYAKSNIENISNYITVLMDDDINAAILKPADSLVLMSSGVTTDILPENRADIQAMTLASTAYEQMHKADKLSFLPRLNAFGTYELHDDEIFQGDTDGYLFGAELKWNLFEGNKRFGKAKKSRAQLEKSKLELAKYKNESQMELNKATRMLSVARNNLKLSELALQQSKEALRIRTNRFVQGLEKTTDLLLAETQYSQKQLEYYTTIFNHNYALAYVQFLTKE